MADGADLITFVKTDVSPNPGLTQKEQHRVLFDKWLQATNSSASTILSAIEYDEIRKCLKEELKPSTSLHRRIVRNSFRLVVDLDVSEEAVLCIPAKSIESDDEESQQKFIKVVIKEELFDIIWQHHVQGLKHAGYQRTFRRLKNSNTPIPRAVVQQFTKLCFTCKYNAFKKVVKGTKADEPSDYTNMDQVDESPIAVETMTEEPSFQTLIRENRPIHETLKRSAETSVDEEVGCCHRSLPTVEENLLHDAEGIFAMHVACSLKKLPRLSREMAKLDIQKTLFEYELKLCSES